MNSRARAVPGPEPRSGTRRGTGHPPAWRVHNGSCNDPSRHKTLGRPNQSFEKRARKQKKLEKRAEKARRKAERDAAKKLGPAGDGGSEAPDRDAPDLDATDTDSPDPDAPDRG